MFTLQGPPDKIIAEALELGILCRPVGGWPLRVGVGEGLEVSRDCFWIVNGRGERDLFNPTPNDLTKLWEVTTLDIIRSEFHKASEDPF